MKSDDDSLDCAQVRYKKVVGGYNDIENDFYLNDFPNDDLENKFHKDSWRRSSTINMEKYLASKSLI
jgi:hypothetical protein